MSAAPTPWPRSEFVDDDWIDVCDAVVDAKAAKCRDAAREVRRDERVLEAVERAHVGRLAHANNGGIIRWGRHTNIGYGVNSVRHFVLRHATQIQRVRFMRPCDAVP